MIKYLIEKEFKQLLRNSFLPRLIFIFPCMIMLLMPWAANLEIKNIRMNIIDNDHSALSRRLVNKITASTYFRTTALPDSYKEGLEAIEAGTADVLLEIPGDFEKDWVNGEAAHVLVAANAVNGTKGGLGSSYLSAIINDYGTELQAESGNIPVAANGDLPRIDILTQNLFNPNLDYKLFMIPALMVMLLTMLCGFLPALNIVGEKEAGTIEQINVTPVGKFTFILAKLIPYWLIGFVVLTLCFILAWALYGIFPAGHFLVIYFFAIIFVLAVSGLGLVISNHSATMQQAMFVMWFCMLILILMSGLFTPVRSMPEWAQWITMLNPLKYFMQVMRMVYLKGSGSIDLLPQLGALLAFALFFNIWAVKSYRKSG
ncbi:ABC transporter permease [Bacteroides fragilis]|uniref:ABC transporter permease n=1 Tax=Bacteroides fragilis TaxID=817 RepID=UPI002030541C|nr:ABC transporter permease [Bacteroides fragilis]MCM0220521.1 ABC transporter permease [Bacteroides fragilis]MCM0266435.1 ABC transporter permease [Bacteroides fragilis]